LVPNSESGLVCSLDLSMLPQLIGSRTGPRRLSRMSLRDSSKKLRSIKKESKRRLVITWPSFIFLLKKQIKNSEPK
jgi:hypothetical protein